MLRRMGSERLKDAEMVFNTPDGVNPLGSVAVPFQVTVGGFDTAMASTIAAKINLASVSMRLLERFSSPAPGATIHASMASGAALNVITAFTRMVPASNIRLSRGGAGVATVYTITGTRFGNAQTETINSNGASDVEGLKIFDTVTGITSDVDPTVTTTMKTGVMLGLAQTCVSIDFLAVSATAAANGVTETVTINAAKDGFTPTTAPDGTKVFTIRYLVTVAPVAA